MRRAVVLLTMCTTLGGCAAWRPPLRGAVPPLDAPSARAMAESAGRFIAGRYAPARTTLVMAREVGVFGPALDTALREEGFAVAAGASSVGSNQDGLPVRFAAGVSGAYRRWAVVDVGTARYGCEFEKGPLGLQLLGGWSVTGEAGNGAWVQAQALAAQRGWPYRGVVAAVVSRQGSGMAGWNELVASSGPMDLMSALGVIAPMRRDAVSSARGVVESVAGPAVEIHGPGWRALGERTVKWAAGTRRQALDEVLAEAGAQATVSKNLVDVTVAPPAPVVAQDGEVVGTGVKQ